MLVKIVKLCVRRVVGFGTYRRGVLVIVLIGFVYDCCYFFFLMCVKGGSEFERLGGY